MWKLFRQEDGEWKETGETFTGAQEDINAYLAQRTAEDGWAYKAEPA